MIEEKRNNLIVKRVFDAPSELVFRAWTEPEILARWWGAKGYTTTFCSIDLRPGGIFIYEFLDPKGREIRFKGSYREVEPTRKLVFTNGVVDKNDVSAPHPDLPAWPRETVITVTFEEREGKTEVFLVHSVEEGTPPEFEAFGIGREGARRFWKEEFDRLENDLAMKDAAV